MRNKDLRFLSEAYEKIYTENHGKLIHLMEELPDGSNAMSAVFHFKNYYGGQNTEMYKIMSTGRINILDILNLRKEVEEAKNIASQNGELEDADDFDHLLKELSKIENKYQYIFDQEDTEDQTQSQI